MFPREITAEITDLSELNGVPVTVAHEEVMVAQCEGLQEDRWCTLRPVQQDEVDMVSL